MDEETTGDDAQTATQPEDTETEIKLSDEPHEHEKPSKHKKTVSQQMLDAHAVDEEMLTEMAFAKCIVKCPCALCCLIMAALILICVIDAALFEFTTDGTRTYFPNPPDKYVDAWDGFVMVTEMISFTEENDTNSITQSEEVPFFMFQMFFTLDSYANDFDEDNANDTDYWILTPENIQTILKWEDKIYADKTWRHQFCYVGSDPMETNYTCQLNTEEAAVISPARAVHEYFVNVLDNPDNYTTDDVKDFVLDNLEDFRFCFNPGAFETGQTYIYRSFFKAGAPIGNGKFHWENETRVHLTDYKNAEDRLNEDQETEYFEWAIELYDEMLMRPKGDLKDGNLEIMVANFVCSYSYFEILLFGSFTFFFLAVFAVFAYMTFHLQSIFLASSAMFQILMAFPLAYIVYRIVFGIQYFDFLNTLIIFVLLGVGADDVFVFTDAWLQSVHFVPDMEALTGDAAKNCCGCDKSQEPRNITRMSFTYRRAAKAMLVTQLTTFFAFLATASSTLMPMSAFGLWAAAIVAMNYVLVITMYPAIIIIHHKYVKSWEEKILCFCCNLCSAKKRRAKESAASSSVLDKDKANNAADDANPDDAPAITRQLSVEEQAEEYRKFERFLGTKFAVFVINFRWWILAFFSVLFIAAIYAATQMQTATKIDSMLFDDHPIQRSQSKLDEFSASETDALIDGFITFGIADIDRTGSRKYRPDENYGSIVWDENFQISSLPQQRYLRYICEAFKNESVPNGGDLIYSADSVVCPIELFATFLEATGSAFPFRHYGFDISQEEAFTAKWQEFLSTPWGYMALQYGLTYLDTEADKIRYYAMYVQTPLSWVSGGDEVETFLSDFEAFLDAVTGPHSGCPENLCDSVNNVNFRWVFVSVTAAFISSAIQGIIIAMPLAFVIMIFSTQNWIIALFAVLDICGVMATELAFMYICGWDFGLSESLSIIIIIGFSVDYVVHLANAYLESSSPTRNERLSFSLLTMGISVVSGAVTTFGAGFFLIFPEITFFVKMGYIMISTVIVSIVWAMFFFTSVCAAFGPQEHSGDIKKYIAKLWCCRKAPKSNEDESMMKENIEMQDVR